MLTWDRLQALGGISDEPGRLTRVFGGPGMRAASTQLAEWMRTARLTVTTDDWGNLFARTPHPDSMPLLVIGSHFDTVPDAGKYDGALGILAALGALESLSQDEIKHLPFAVEIAAFSDEEGTRFQTTYLGSRAATGAIEPADLARRDSTGIPLSSLVPEKSHRPAPRYTKKKLLAYWEAHIEQGPVLESLGLPLGIVTAIAGQTRAKISLIGHAAHAGTCPMALRQDALAGAAEFVLAAESLAKETKDLVATVGCLEVPHSASNVVPARADLTLDLRHPENPARQNAVAALREKAASLAARRGLEFTWDTVQENPAVACDAAQTEILRTAIAAHQPQVPSLFSGAGHDAVAMSAAAPVAMFFVRCRGGVSHHPTEFASAEDVSAAVKTLAEAIRQLARR
ncbi:MAG: M20 family metallo-hydrolase [Terrimicrobiaceae bacterium]